MINDLTVQFDKRCGCLVTNKINGKRNYYQFTYTPHHTSQASEEKNKKKDILQWQRTTNLKWLSLFFKIFVNIYRVLVVLL